MTSAPARVSGTIGRGANGASRARLIYRGSPLRRLLKVNLDHRGLRADDIFLASYPRSGNSWLRFLVLDMCGRPATFDSVSREVPYVGGQRGAPDLVPNGGRLIKTHEPYLPVYRRAIHLVRDPRDVVISYFRYMQRVERIVLGPTDDAAATFDRFVDVYLAGRVDAHGTWHTHLDSWLGAARSGQCRVLRIRYEDLRAEPVAGVLEIGRWLGLTITQLRADEIVERCSIEQMRHAEREALRLTPGALPAAAGRTGISLLGDGLVGDWRNALTTDQQRRFAAFSSGIAVLGYEAPIQP